MPTNRKRVALDFKPDSFNRLDRLKELTKAGSYAEVVANALRLYESIIDEGGHKARLVVQKPDGTTVLLRLFT